MAGGSIYAGIFKKPFSLAGRQSRRGVALTMGGGRLTIFFLKDPFQGLIWSQIFLGLQLPWTIFSLNYLTSAKKVMGPYTNTPANKLLLLAIGSTVTILNGWLLIGFLFPG
jgi:manganese transport protein